MNDLKKIIQESILLAENIQQADKVYFTTGLLSPRVREIILRITHGDALTKIITDIYYKEFTHRKKSASAILNGFGDDEEDEELKNKGNDVLDREYWETLRDRYYKQLKSYNKNVFPIKGFNLNGTLDINELTRALYQRYKILEGLKNLPSVSIRNMKEDIRKERNSSELNTYRDRLDYFLAQYSLLSNREGRFKSLIANKMFRANTTLEDLIDFSEEKENLIGGKKLNKSVINNIIAENEDELEVVFQKGNKIVVDVTGEYGIKAIGCNSVWCFTYGGNAYSRGGQWYQNSTNNHAYVIIDFDQPSDSPGFMYVLVKPLDFSSEYDDSNGDVDNQDKMADMSNQFTDNPLGIIYNFMTPQEAYMIFNFGEYREGPNSKYPYEDPNQLKLDLKEIRKIVQKVFTESLSKIKKVYVGSELGVNRFMRNVVGEISPYINRLSDTEVSIDPIAFSIESALEGEGGMLDFFGLTPKSGIDVKYDYNLNEAKKSKFEKLKDNKVPLTSEEREKVMKAKAVWHHGPNGEETPAVWKSKDKNGKIAYVTNTHRAYQDRPTLKGAISIYHSFIKSTS